MSPMPGTQATDMAPQASSAVKWKAVFSDPTFGGECIPFPVRQVSHDRSMNRFTPEPILEDLPDDVELPMVSAASMKSLKGESPTPVAGTGKKAAEHLRRLSGESKNSKKSESSGFSDSDDGSKKGGKSKDDKKSEDGGLSDSSSGLSDSDDGGKKDKKKGSKGSAAAAPQVAYDSEGNPVRYDRRAATIEQPQKESSFGDSDSDKDLLSNPFASDSEEEKEDVVKNAEEALSKEGGEDAG